MSKKRLRKISQDQKSRKGLTNNTLKSNLPGSKILKETLLSLDYLAGSLRAFRPEPDGGAEFNK
jgi:hypothetical protein